MKNTFMEMRHILSLLLACLSFLWLQAQENMYEIKTINGKWYGDTMWVKQDSICVSSIGITQCISANEVVSYRNFNFDAQVLQKGMQLYNTYAIATQTAFGQKKGTFMYRNFLIFDNSLTYGITDELSLQLGNTLYGSNALEGPFTPYLAVKASIPILKNKINIAGRMAFQRAADFDHYYEDNSYLYYNNDYVFTYGAIITLGSPDNNVNIGYLFEDNKYKVNSKLLSIGAKCRIGQSTSVLLETYSFNGKTEGLSVGMRSDFRKGSLSYGMILTGPDSYLDSDGIPLPYASFTFPF